MSLHALANLSRLQQSACLILLWKKLTKYDTQLFKKVWIEYGVRTFVQEHDRKTYGKPISTDFVDQHSLLAAKTPVRFITDYAACRPKNNVHASTPLAGSNPLRRCEMQS